MRFTLEIEQETDGRWIAEVPELPGTLTYGGTQEEAIAKAKALTFAFHDGEEIGPRMLARIARRTGLTPDDL